MNGVRARRCLVRAALLAFVIALVACSRLEKVRREHSAAADPPRPVAFALYRLDEEIDLFTDVPEVRGR